MPDRGADQRRERTEEKWAKLPPLVGPEESGALFSTREKAFETLVERWTTPVPAGWREETDPGIEKGGRVLRDVALVVLTDGAQIPIDLGDLSRAVQNRVEESAEPGVLGQRLHSHIVLSACRIDLCDASSCFTGGKLLVPHSRFGDNTRFYGSRFGRGTTFAGVRFGNSANFDESDFGYGIDFAGTRFGDRTSFHDVQFGDMACFKNTTFGDRTDFGGATFRFGASFKDAIFGDATSFIGTVFGNSAVWSGAIFGRNASFNWATFGHGTDFVGSTFDGEPTFQGCRFRGGPDITAVNLRSTPISLLGWRRRCGFFEKITTWARVRGIGQLQILTRASFWALLVVPLLAGLWPMTDVGARLLTLSARLLMAQALHLLPERYARCFEDREVSFVSLDFPWDWVLAYAAALAVVGGHALFQAFGTPLVKETDREAHAARKRSEFVDAGEAQRDDRLRQAFADLAEIARVLPHARNQTLVRRGRVTQWLPASLDDLRALPTSEEDAKAQAEEREAYEQWRKDVKAAKEAGQELRPEDDQEAERWRRWRVVPPGGRLMAYREELEPVVVEEGALADYDLKARESRGLAAASAALYGVGLVCILALLARQLCRVAVAAGVGWWLAGGVIVLAAVAAAGGIVWAAAKLLRWWRRQKSWRALRPSRAWLRW